MFWFGIQVPRLQVGLLNHGLNIQPVKKPCDLANLLLYTSIKPPTN